MNTFRYERFYISRFHNHISEMFDSVDKKRGQSDFKIQFSEDLFGHNMLEAECGF